MEILGLPTDMIGRILLAAVLGAAAGIERDLSGKPAGLRTNMIIAISACLITILSIDVLSQMSDRVDISRMAAGIVSGVGFLGAGVIMHHKNNVNGLTSAADIWLVAALGMAVGVRMYALAVFVSLFTILSLTGLSPVSYYFSNSGKKKNSNLNNGNEEKAGNAK